MTVAEGAEQTDLLSSSLTRFKRSGRINPLKIQGSLIRERTRGSRTNRSPCCSGIAFATENFTASAILQSFPFANAKISRSDRQSYWKVFDIHTPSGEGAIRVRGGRKRRKSREIGSENEVSTGEPSIYRGFSTGKLVFTWKGKSVSFIFPTDNIY